MSEIATVPSHQMEKWARQPSISIDRQIHESLLLVSEQFGKSNMFGKNAHQVYTSMMIGYALGLDPIMCAGKIHVFSGSYQIHYVLLATMIERSTKYQIDEVIRTGNQCQIDIYKNETKIASVVWDMDRASRAGLAGKDNWKKYPETMLYARAVTEAVNVYMPDLIGTPVYTEADNIEVSVSPSTNGQATPSTPSPKPTETPASPPQEVPTNHLDRVKATWINFRDTCGLNEFDRNKFFTDLCSEHEVGDVNSMTPQQAEAIIKAIEEKKNALGNS